jgi:hypothetical protein
MTKKPCRSLEVRYERDRELLRHIVAFPVLKARYCELGQDLLPDALSDSLPTWDRATPILKAAYASLPMTLPGLQLMPFLFRLSRPKYTALRKNPQGLMSGLREELWAKFYRSIGPTQFWMTIRLIEKARDDRTATLAFVVGGVWIEPGDTTSAIKVLASSASQTSVGGTSLQIAPGKSLASLVTLATRDAVVTRQRIEGSEFACTRELGGSARAIYETVKAEAIVGEALMAPMNREAWGDAGVLLDRQDGNRSAPYNTPFVGR